jgi:hypothetical protein
VNPVPEELLTLEQLDQCVRGELFVIAKWKHGPDEPYPSREFYLHRPESRQEYEAAKVRGWCRLDLSPWRKFCQLSGRPHAYLSVRAGRCTQLHIGTPDGLGLSRGGVDRVYALLNPHVRKGHEVRVGDHGVFARFAKADTGTAEELIAPLLDLLLENLCPRNPERSYSRDRSGVSECDAGKETDYSAADALAAALDRVRPEDVPVVCDDRDVTQKEQAALARRLFKTLGLKKIRVRVQTYSMGFGVDVRLPMARDWPRLGERVRRILDVAFPAHGGYWSVD